MSSIIEFIFANVKMYGEAMEKLHKMRFVKEDVGFDLTRNLILVRFDDNGKEVTHRFGVDMFRSQNSVKDYISMAENLLESINEH